MATDPVKTRRRSLRLAYGAYLWIMLCFVISGSIEWFYGRPGSAQQFATYQGLGMLVVLPLSMSALVGAVLGIKASLRLIADWAKQPGLWVMPLLLLLILAVFALVEAGHFPRWSLSASAIVYCLATTWFTVRWFLASRAVVQPPG